MEYKINLEFLSPDTYKEIEIDIYRKGKANSYDYVKTVRLNEDATLYQSGKDFWTLELRDYNDRDLLFRAHYLKFMSAVYRNTEEKPFPEQGELLYRTPLIDRFFALPQDNNLRGKGKYLRLYAKTEKILDSENDNNKL